jgi:hypothetical protein
MAGGAIGADRDADDAATHRVPLMARGFDRLC